EDHCQSHSSSSTMAEPERIDIWKSIPCPPSKTNFFDLTLDCQRHFFRNVSLNQRMLIRAVCSRWKLMVEDSLKNVKKLRIFDSRQSLADYAHTLNRASLQRDCELSFGPYDTLIITTPEKLVEEEKRRVAEEKAKKKAEEEEKQRVEKEAREKKLAEEKN